MAIQTTIDQLKEYWTLCKAQYVTEHRKMKMLDSTDKGDLWKALGAKFPPYQILPDTNHTAYIKNNLIASIYTVTLSADIQPTSDRDKSIVENLNIAMDCIWNLSNVGFYQFQAGERAALLNMGITQVGWDETLTAGSGDAFYKGNVTLKNIDPIKFMRDPYAIDLESAGYCMTYDIYHKSVFEENPNYKEAFAAYLATSKGATPEVIPEMDSTLVQNKYAAKDYYTLVTFWVKENGKIHEIHTINCEKILYSKEDIKPSCFPFAVLYCNLPAGTLIGTSEPAKIFANSVAYNLMDSIALTAEYKNQRPPKFISAQSGLNIQSFSKHGDEADRTFVVSGRADQAVTYHQFPQVSNLISQLRTGLAYDIQTITGIDGRYTGRDTGSVLTTGGMDQMMSRVTLVDEPKIMLYENYSKRLTQLILYNFLEYSPERKYFYQKPNSTAWFSLDCPFPKIDKDTVFNYQMNISAELPKTKQRVAEAASALMEKQMQYQQEGTSVELITAEEWLMMQDLPNKELMLERMGVQRLEDATEEVSQVLFQYANLLQNGVDPDTAMLSTAKSLRDKRLGNMPTPPPNLDPTMIAQQPPMQAPPMNNNAPIM